MQRCRGPRAASHRPIDERTRGARLLTFAGGPRKDSFRVKDRAQSEAERAALDPRPAAPVSRGGNSGAEVTRRRVEPRRVMRARVLWVVSEADVWLREWGLFMQSG